MSEIKIDTSLIQNALSELLATFSPGLNGHGRVEAYEDLARRISAIANKHWSWRYVKSVMSGTVEPGQRFSRTVMLLAGSLDGSEAIDLEPVTIYARPGTVHQNAIVFTASRPCARPGCPVWFVPVVYNQKYHSQECRARHRKEVKVQIT